MNKPTFTISAKLINLIADISAQVERYAIRMEQEDGFVLRNKNRIKIIQASLAIEGNTLSENMITDILEGKPVVAPLRKIQEVKNAIKTYDAFSTLNPYSINDLLRAQGLMMETLIEEAGSFRKGGVGVFSGTIAVHVAPPAERVPFLMDDLFEWLKESNDHLLIKSCIFHYKFEFIHPFIDGNGRIGRLWQSLILSKLHPIFEHLPVESIIFQNQQQYYDAISRSTRTSDSAHFIEFMLEEILTTLRNRQGIALKSENNDTVSDTVSINPEPQSHQKPNDTVNTNSYSVDNKVISGNNNDTVNEKTDDTVNIIASDTENNTTNDTVLFNTNDTVTEISKTTNLGDNEEVEKEVVSIINNDTVSDTVSEVVNFDEKQSNDTVSDTVNHIKSNPKITLDELALRLNKSRRTVTRTIKKLQEEGIISRNGSDKTGYWEVNIS
ncbi:MAG: Fic family protein [Paludibacter sp.]